MCNTLLAEGDMHAGKLDLVGQLLAAKEASGKTFTQISEEVGLTNAFTAQLFHNQVCDENAFSGLLLCTSCLVVKVQL